MTVVPSRDLLSLGTSVGAGDRIITGQRIPVVVPSRRTPTPWSCLRWRAPLDKLCSPPRVRPSVLLAVRSGGSRLRDAGDRPDEAYISRRLGWRPRPSACGRPPGADIARIAEPALSTRYSERPWTAARVGHAACGGPRPPCGMSGSFDQHALRQRVAGLGDASRRMGVPDECSLGARPR